MSKIWHNRIQNEFLQLEPENVDGGQESMLPACVEVGEKSLDLDNGTCNLNVKIKINQQGKEDDKDCFLIVGMDISEKVTNFPFMPPRIYLSSLVGLELPNGSTLIPVEESGEEGSSKSFLEFDLEWTPNLTLAFVIQHLALKLRESVLQDEPIYCSTTGNQLIQDSVYEHEVSEITENYKIGKQKISEYFTKFTKKIDDFLEEDDVNNNVFDTSTVDEYFEADLLKDQKEKHKTRGFFANFLKPKKYLGVTIDNLYLVYIDEHGVLFGKWDLNKLAKLKFRRGESISLFFTDSKPLIFLCERSLDLAKTLQRTLANLGISGKHTDVKKRNALQNAQNLMELAQIKIENAASLKSADEVEEVMSLLRNSAEEFAAADKPSDKVMRTLHSFLEIPHIRSLLSEQAKKIDEIRDTGIKEPETLTSQSDTPQQQKSEITESKDDTSNLTSSIGGEGESLNTEANDKSVPPSDEEVHSPPKEPLTSVPEPTVPVGEVLESSPWAHYDEDDEELDHGFDSDYETNDVEASDIETSDIETKNTSSLTPPSSLSPLTLPSEENEDVISSELSDFIKQADMKLHNLMKS